MGVDGSDHDLTLIRPIPSNITQTENRCAEMNALEFLRVSSFLAYHGRH